MKRYRYRAYPTGEQENNLSRLFGCVRVVFNDALAARETARRSGKVIPTYAQLSAALPEAKRTPERAWLREVSSVPLQQALMDLERAYRNFFDSISGKRKGRKWGAPKFKSRKNRRCSARFTRNAGFRVTETTHGVGFVTLPKVGRVRFALSRLLPTTPSSVTVIREPDGRHYFSFVVEEPPPGPFPSTTRAAGVDLGLTHLAVIAYSDGTREKISNPRWLRSRQRTLARAQKALSRKQKGSHNRDKARRKVAAQHRKVRETRLDHHHKLALRLIRENQVIALEGLNVAGLIRTRLSKSVRDAGWGILIKLVQEKAEACGRQVRVIDPREPNSQVCAACAVRDGPKPLHVRVWVCPTCHALLDRDCNAAVNIMVAAGLAETLNACGGDFRRTLAGADPCEPGTRRTARIRAAA